MNGDMYNILVTGACGVTSRSVVRALSISSVFKDKCRFIGTDVCYNLYGAFEGLYDKVYKVPYTTDPEYRSIMLRIMEENNIGYAIVIPEPEVLYWSRHPFDVKFNRIPPRFASSVIDKSKLYELLEGSGLVPEFQKIDSDVSDSDIRLAYPMWMRHFSEGSTSGAGSFLPRDFKQLKAWQTIKYPDTSFLLSEYLPGRNLGCFLLYDNGELLRYGTLERCEYIMGKVSVSGITGNTSRGRLINDKEPAVVADNAVRHICALTGETMNGLVVVDMKEDSHGKPFVTEINIRHVAMSEIMALAGLNFAEAQMLLLCGDTSLHTSDKTLQFPSDNIFLRDVDGRPVWLPHFHNVQTGSPFPTAPKGGCR